MKPETRPETLTVHKCKVDKKLFSTAEELTEHLRERHSESFTVQRVSETPVQVPAPVKETKPMKKSKPQKKSEDTGRPQTDVSSPAPASPEIAEIPT